MIHCVFWVEPQVTTSIRITQFVTLSGFITSEKELEGGESHGKSSCDDACVRTAQRNRQVEGPEFLKLSLPIFYTRLDLTLDYIDELWVRVVHEEHMVSAFDIVEAAHDV